MHSTGYSASKLVVGVGHFAFWDPCSELVLGFPPPFATGGVMEVGGGRRTTFSRIHLHPGCAAPSFPILYYHCFSFVLGSYLYCITFLIYSHCISIESVLEFCKISQDAACCLTYQFFTFVVLISFQPHILIVFVFVFASYLFCVCFCIFFIFVLYLLLHLLHICFVFASYLFVFAFVFTSICLYLLLYLLHIWFVFAYIFASYLFCVCFCIYFIFVLYLLLYLLHICFVFVRKSWDPSSSPGRSGPSFPILGFVLLHQLLSEYFAPIAVRVFA